MQADAAKLSENLVVPGVLPAARRSVEARKKPRNVKFRYPCSGVAPVPVLQGP
jgi:hypothetical protein